MLNKHDIFWLNNRRVIMLNKHEILRVHMLNKQEILRVLMLKTLNNESTYVKQTRKIRAHIERQQEESPKSHVRIVRPGTIARRARPHPPSITVLQVCFTPPLRTSGKYSPNIDQVLTKYQANIDRILTKCDQNLTKY